MVIKHPVVFVLALVALVGVSRMAPTAQQTASDGPQYTSGAKLILPADFKDRARFPDTTWGYFTFGSAPNLTQSAAPLPTSESCYACHKNNTAVEQTFVQFYPTLFEVARRMGTVKPTYDPARKP